MLEAAPHRGGEFSTRVCGSTVVAVSFEADQRDAWLASDNGTVAAFVGTLDNADELAHELARGGPTVSDPAAILLQATRHWGEDAVGRLRGAFVGAISDGSTLRCFKDHLGLRPLFYREAADGFFVGTEAKQVAAGAGISREPDLEALEDLFYGRLAPETAALKGVDRFPRASVASITTGSSVRFRRYWDPRSLLETARLSSSDVRERLGELLESVVTRSVTGNDVVSLSGGIDSPTIAALAAPRHRELSGRELPALSSVYPDFPSVDERKYTELVASYLGLPLHTYVPTARPLDQIDRWVDLVDGPVETLSLPELAENYLRARSLGGRAVLSGEMAEWVFTFGAHLIGHLVLHGRISAATRWLREQRSYGGSWRTVARVAAPSLTPAFLANHYLRLRRRGTGQLPLWIDPAQTGDVGYRPDLARPARDRWLEHQLDPLLSPAATSFDADETCAAVCGVHVKRPLADIDLWEFLLSLPAEAKFPSSVPKVLIRDVMRGRLPDAILDRRDKTGFATWVLGMADYAGLRRWLAAPATRMGGVNYKLLGARLDAESMDVLELMWAYDLARVHAFLGLWQ
jgi:asparagine synthase (glutamine-hydrolysing)